MPNPLPFTPGQLSVARAFVAADTAHTAARGADADPVQERALYHTAEARRAELEAVVIPWPLQETVKLAARAEQTTLPAILDQMEAATHNGDLEDAHSQADDLLCQAIFCLTQGKATAGQAAAIVEAYQRVGKWYA